MPRLSTQSGRVLQLALTLVLPSLVTAVVLLFQFVDHGAWRWGLTIGLVVASLLSLLALLQQSRQAFGRIANGLAAARLGPDAARDAVPVNRELEHALGEIDQLCDILERQRLATDDSRRIRQHFLARIPTPSFVFDETGKLVELNKAAAASLGASPATLVGSPADALGLQQLIAPEKERYAIQLDGRRVERMEIVEGGQRLNVVFVESEHTHPSQPRDRERGSWQHLFRVLVHEVNNSLTPIRTMADSLRMQLGEPLPQDWRTRFASSMEAIGQRSQRLSKFIDGYSELAKIPHPVVSRIHVGQWLGELATMERRVKVHVDAGPDVTLLADPTLLDQAMLNLLVNAAEASQSTDGQIRISWRVDEGNLELRVDDEGPGLVPGIDVFLPNVSTKPGGGGGLGLALCREIAEAHGGTVDLENRSGRRGCRATMRLPIDGKPQHDVVIPRPATAIDTPADTTANTPKAKDESQRS